MRRAAVCFLSALIAVIAAAGPAAAQTSKAKTDQGAALFVSQKCTMCHSIAGKGNPKGSLDGVASKAKADEIRQWITDPDGMRAKANATRTPAMKVIKLSPDQLDALVAYLATLKAARTDADAER